MEFDTDEDAVDEPDHEAEVEADIDSEDDGVDDNEMVREVLAVELCDCDRVDEAEELSV